MESYRIGQSFAAVCIKVGIDQFDLGAFAEWCKGIGGPRRSLQVRLVRQGFDEAVAHESRGLMFAEGK
jgi:hypothetical protein